MLPFRFLAVVALLAGRLAAAQAPKAAVPAAQQYQPVYLLNSHLLVGESWLRATDPNELASLQVYKAETMPARWRSFAPHGIVDFTLKAPREPAAKKLTDLSQWLGLTEPVQFTLDGLPIEDRSLLIASDAIAALEITRSTPGSMGTVVNIRLAHPAPAFSPPGVYIRGKSDLN